MSTAFAPTPQIRRKRLIQNVVLGSTLAATIFIALPVVVVVWYVVSHGASAITPEFLFDGPARAGREGGFWPVIVLTLYGLVLAALFAVPTGVACAIYLFFSIISSRDRQHEESALT